MHTHLFTWDNELMRIHVYCSKWFFIGSLFFLTQKVFHQFIVFPDTKGFSSVHCFSWHKRHASQIAKFMGPTWAHLGPVSPRWAPCWPHEPMGIQLTICLSCTLHVTPADDLVSNENISRYSVYRLHCWTHGNFFLCVQVATPLSFLKWRKNPEKY